MTTVAAMDYDYEPVEVTQGSGKWWVLLLTGVGWIIISVIVLRADLDSALTVGYLVAGFLVALGMMEFVAIGVTEGWKWLHIALGVLFVVGGVLALTEPFQTYMMLASLLGLLLVLKGTFDFVAALASRRVSDLWWMLLIAGILEILLGFWAASYPGRSAYLLLLWVGIGSLLRGITQLILAFKIRKIHEAVVR